MERNNAVIDRGMPRFRREGDGILGTGPSYNEPAQNYQDPLRLDGILGAPPSRNDSAQNYEDPHRIDGILGAPLSYNEPAQNYEDPLRLDGILGAPPSHNNSAQNYEDPLRIDGILGAPPSYNEPAQNYEDPLRPDGILGAPPSRNDSAQKYEDPLRIDGILGAPPSHNDSAQNYKEPLRNDGILGAPPSYNEPAQNFEDPLRLDGILGAPPSHNDSAQNYKDPPRNDGILGAAPIYNDPTQNYKEPLRIDCDPQSSGAYFDIGFDSNVKKIFRENDVEEFSARAWQNLNSDNIFVWLKSYIGDSDEGTSFFDGLKFLALQKKWTVFRNVITQKWISLGYDIYETDCLESKRVCVAIWAQLSLCDRKDNTRHNEIPYSKSVHSGKNNNSSVKSHQRSPSNNRSASNEGYDGRLQITIKNHSRGDNQLPYDNPSHSQMIHPSKTFDDFRSKFFKENGLIEFDERSWQKLNDYDIVRWLKDYISDGQEGRDFFNGLKFLALEKKWSVFRNIIKQKWISLGYNADYADCLEGLRMCVAAWTEMNITNLQNDQDQQRDHSRGKSDYDRPARQTDARHRDWYNKERDGSRGKSSRDERDERDRRHKGSNAEIDKVRINQKNKSNLLAWLTSYISNDPNGKHMLNELDYLASKRQWKDFASLIRNDWLSLGHNSEDTLCLDDWQCCEDIWRNFCQGQSDDRHRDDSAYDTSSQSTRSPHRLYYENSDYKGDSKPNIEANNPDNKRKRAANYEILENDWRVDSFGYSKVKR